MTLNRCWQRLGFCSLDSGSSFLFPAVPDTTMWQAMRSTADPLPILHTDGVHWQNAASSAVKEPVTPPEAFHAAKERGSCQ